MGDKVHLRSALVGGVLAALIVSVLPVLAASVGDPLSLGEVNRIDERTDWKGKAKGAVLQVKNTGNSSAIAAKADKQAIVAKATDGPVAVNAKADRVAVKIKVDPGQAPIKVNASAGTATNLSADLLDGMDSSDFLGAGDTAADSDLLDGLDSGDLEPGTQCASGESFVGWERSGPACRAPGDTRDVTVLDGDAGRGISLALDGAGNPVIAFEDTVANGLSVIHCFDRRCEDTGGSNLVDGLTSHVGLSPSLVFDAVGHPVIAYVDSTNDVLKLAHCLDPACDAETIETLDGDVGTDTSLVLDAAGNPVIAYRDQVLKDLKLVHCNDPDCAGDDESIETIDAGPDSVGEWASLVLDASGNPVVAYYDLSNNALKLAHCNDPDCAGGDESIVVVDGSSGSAGENLSLALDPDGNPVISYRDDDSLDLRLAHCDDPDCAGGGESIETVDDGPGDVQDTSLVLTQAGLPVISYYDADDSGLRVAHCNDPNCAGDDEWIETIDAFQTVGFGSSLVLDVHGRVVVAYLDFTNSDLMFAVP